MSKSKDIFGLVKQLREQTGAGVMECKQALEKSAGDLKKAQEFLKKSGLVKAQKRAKKATNQGYVATYTHNTGRVGVVVEFLSESDFVSKNEEFRQVAREICLQIAAMDPKDLKELLAQDYIRQPDQTIADLVAGMIAKFGENIKIGRFQRLAI
ncbi:MAG: translation elongation factor Ts [Patescibacteria group bacterium]